MPPLDRSQSLTYFVTAKGSNFICRPIVITKLTLPVTGQCGQNLNPCCK